MEMPDSTVTPPAVTAEVVRARDDATKPSDETGHRSSQPEEESSLKQNQVSQVVLYGISIVSLTMDGKERLCLAQISNTLLKTFSYNEIHNRRVALGITCVQCTPVQLEVLRRAGAMPVSSRRCGMITKREAERLCKSFLGDNAPPKLPESFTFDVLHLCAWGCRGLFYPSRYNSSRAKCIKCSLCGSFYSPNKFIFHSHHTADATYVQPDAANFNSWRRHIRLHGSPPEEIVHAWEDVKAMFNGGTRKRAPPVTSSPPSAKQARTESGGGGGAGGGAPLEVTGSSYPELVRPTPSLVAAPMAAACFPRLPALGAYKRLAGLETPSFADYLWPAAKWSDLSPLSSAHLWPKRTSFGFPLAAPAVLGGLLDYSVYSLHPPGLAPSAPLPSPPKECRAPMPPSAGSSSAFRPLRQPWLTEAAAAAGGADLAKVRGVVPAETAIETQVTTPATADWCHPGMEKHLEHAERSSPLPREEDRLRSLFMLSSCLPQREEKTMLSHR